MTPAPTFPEFPNHSSPLTAGLEEAGVGVVVEAAAAWSPAQKEDLAIFREKLVSTSKEFRVLLSSAEPAD